ncbi:HAD-IIA family hydrolase [Svornostia abyssi]|uniref:HAD-IIA family hydrolase n=1 Tax=Svornostia abyssi TaxID=2898438 RepID=A0ABY5PDC4_9ACTN|nr:HAD-IIA family hydrolase [Parviterribacteraceae bacterium J379]
MLSPAVAPYDHVLLDLDGCVWVGDEPTPRAAEALSALRAAGRGIAFVTNDGRHSGEDFVRKLWRLGMQASAEEVVTVGGALQFLLAERHGAQRAPAVVIGSESIHRHVEASGMRIVNGTDFVSRAAVAVVSGHERFDFAELRDATTAVLRGATLIATSRDPTYPTADGLWPGTGALVAAVETATGQRAHTIGKPEAGLVHAALDRLGPGRALFIGDRLDTDLAAAHNAGIDGAVVLTGSTTRQEAEAADPSPVAIAANLAELVLGTSP